MSIPILPQPVNGLVTSGDGSSPALSVQAIDGNPSLSTYDAQARRIQETLLLVQQANLLSTQLVNDKTGRYNFIEVR